MPIQKVLCETHAFTQQRMQDASPMSSSVLALTPEYIPVPAVSYEEAAENYAMGMLSALQGTAALGAGLHIAGSLFIVYGQTLVKVRLYNMPPHLTATVYV